MNQMDDILRLLPKFTDPEGEPWKAQPFGVRIGKTIWAVASNGVCIFAVKSSTVPLGDSEQIRRVITILSTPLVEPKVVSLADVQAWAGAPERIEGREVDDQYVGAIDGVVVDRRRLYLIVKELPFPKITIWNASGIGAYALGIEGEKGKFRAVLAGLARAPEPGDNVFGGKPPQKEPASPTTTGLDLVMSMESED